MLYKKIDDSSKDTVSNSLDLFSLPGTDVTAQKSQYREYLSLNPVSDPPLTFKIFAGSSFIDLSKCYLLSEMHIVKKDENGNWKNLEADDKPSVIQGIGSTFIENLKITLNGREISTSNRLQAYRSYMDLCLNYGYDACNSHLQLAGFYEEETVNDPSDYGYAARQNLFKNGAKAQFISRIHADIFLQDKLLLNQTEMEIEVTPRLNDNFCIQAESTDNNVYRLVLNNCRLYVKMIDIIDGLSLSFASTLMQKSAKYALKRVEMKSMVIGGGRREHTSTLFSEQVPRRVILGLVNHTDFTGSTKNSPFNFLNAGIQSVTLSANGLQFPSVPFNLDFSRDLYARAYHHFLDNIGFAFTNSSNNISLRKYKNGFCFFVFNLTTSLEDPAQFDLLKSGSTTLVIRFDTDVPASGLELIVYAEFDGILMIDTNRMIVSDLTA